MQLVNCIGPYEEGARDKQKIKGERKQKAEENKR